MSRATDLFEAVDRFTDAHDTWADDQNSSHPTLSYWNALDAMLATFENGDLPAECRELASRVWALAQERVKFDASEAASPGHSFWLARERLADMAKRTRESPEKRHLEPIAELHRQNVPHEQIARIWGLVREDGSGKAYLVQQELNSPGSVITPDFVHPDDALRLREAQESRRRYLELSSQLGQQAIQTKIEEDPPCPETPLELWLQNVSVRQAAQMLKMSPEVVSKLFQGFEMDRRQREGKASPENSAAVATTTVAPPVEPPVATDEVTPEEELEAELEGSDDDEFAAWTDEDIRAEAKLLGISTRGRYNREMLIAKIREAEPVPEDAVAGEE